MDRSTSSLPIGRKTRDSSPISERGRIIADLESQTSALGHVGLLKWQRNDLRKELLQQKGLAEFERQNAANARKLALRLAAQIAVKEARLKSHAEALSKAHGNAYLVERNSDAVVKDLESKLQEDLTLANSLLRTFGGSDGISSHDGLSFHVSSRPISPPLSPFNGKEPIIKRQRSLSSQHLPSELLQLCQLRAETLLRKYRDQQDNLHLLQQTEASLRRSIHEKNSKILKLQSSKDKIGEHLKQAKADIAHLEVDAKTNKQLVAQLLSQKESLESSIASLQDEANALKDVVDHSEHKLAATERQLKHIADQNNNTTTQLIAAENMLKELEAAKVKVENEAELLREQHNESEQLNRTHTCRITELENEIGEIQAQVSELRERKHEHEQIEASLRGELTELEGRFTRHEQDHSEINARLIETTESLEEARTALNAERKKSQELLALRDELKKTIATQEKRAAISDNVIKALREQLATAQSNIASLERGKGQLNEELNQSNLRLEEARAIERQLRDQVQDLEKSIAERQASAASLRSMLESALNAEAGSSQRISDLGSELDDVNGKLLQTEAKLTECSIKLTESERLRKEADSQLTHVKASHSEALDALDSERQRSEQLDTHLVNEKRSVDSVKQLLLEVQSNLDASKGAHSNLQAAKSSLEDELKQTRVEKVSLKEQLSRQMACSHALNEQIRAMTMTQVYLTQELEKQRDQSQTTDHEIARLRVSLAEALDSSNTHQLSSEAAQEQVTNLKAQLRSLEAKFVELQAVERQNLEKANATQMTVDSLKRQLTDGEVEQARLQKELDGVSEQVLRFKEAKVRLESDLRAGREEVLNLQNINQTLQEEVARAQQQIKSLEVENQELLDNFEAVSLANTRLEAINSGLTEDLNVQQQLNQQSHEEKAALENRLRESEAAVSDLHDEIKQLNVQSRETQLQLRKSQAIRVSHENALGSIRVRLGASKMAKRGVQIQLNQAEKDLATLKVQNVRLETTLSNALSEVVGGRSFISEQKQRIVDLQERHERVSQRLLDSEETVQRLQAEVRQLEQESQDFKHEINRLKTIVDQAETEIASLKSEITSLHAQRVMNREELATQRSQIAELQRAKTDLEKSLAERVRLVETQQGNISRLEEEAATDKATIARLDSEKSNIMRLTNSLKAEVDTRDATILDQQRQIEKLEQDLRDARRSAQDLRVKIHDQESQNESLRLQNEAYAIEVPSLREQLQDLKASKAALGAQVQGHTEERVQAETEGKENERVSAQASSPTLVMSELEPPPEEREEDFGPGILDRPMSPHKRINTGHNSMKAFRVLGAEAAASQPSIEEDEMKKELWDLWASQHKLGSLPENENAEQPPEENKPAPRMRRKLTKKKKVEQLNTHETGSLHNLIRYGSFSKPHFERPLRSSRSVSAKH